MNAGRPARVLSLSRPQPFIRSPRASPTGAPVRARRHFVHGASSPALPHANNEDPTAPAAPNRCWGGHVGDQEFLAAWPAHPDFRVIK
ncbi:DUF6368 family protein [Streptomyces sp. NBC_00365]|uniref:DUF6368 family protein n=1 Tax=Streptomyces sp. NBC_00365 TaxID=2975726 RepID=UPI00338DDCD6